MPLHHHLGPEGLLSTRAALVCGPIRLLLMPGWRTNRVPPRWRSSEHNYETWKELWSSWRASTSMNRRDGVRWKWERKLIRSGGRCRRKLDASWLIDCLWNVCNCQICFLRQEIKQLVSELDEEKRIRLSLQVRRHYTNHKCSPNQVQYLFITIKTIFTNQICIITVIMNIISNFYILYFCLSFCYLATVLSIFFMSK